MPLAPPLLWLALTGCLRGSYYPSHETWQLDTGVTTPIVTTPTIPCNRPDEGTVAQLRVNNPTPDLYKISQMDDFCVEQPWFDVLPNDAVTVTVGNHIFFVVREADGTFVRFFGIPSGTQVSWVETLP